MPVYLAGKMTGVAFLNAPRFREEAKRLRDAGIDVVSPVEMDEQAGINFADYPDGKVCQETTAECLMRDLHEILKCDAVAVMPGWFGSRGVSLEIVFAINMGIPVLDAETMKPLNQIDLQTGLLCLKSQ